MVLRAGFLAGAGPRVFVTLVHQFMSARRWLFIACYAGSGAAALIYEVAWTRMLTLQLGHTVAAASTVLAAFMGGLAIGASLAGRLRDGVDANEAHRRRLHAYATLELVVAGVALLLPFALAASMPALAWAYEDGAAPARFALVRIAISLALLSVPAAAMGATFPIAAAWFADHRARGSSAAADAGLLYAANTAGAAVGAIAAGFFLIPALGLDGTTWVGVALNLIAAGGAFWIARGQPETTPINAAATHRTDKIARSPERTRDHAYKPPAAAPSSPALACTPRRSPASSR